MSIITKIKRLLRKRHKPQPHTIVYERLAFYYCGKCRDSWQEWVSENHEKPKKIGCPHCFHKAEVIDEN